MKQTIRPVISTEERRRFKTYRPTVYETLEPNQVYTVSGAAWAGETDVTETAVSTDGGQSWAEAEFLDPIRRHAWRRWKFDWLTPKQPGQYTLLARAKDAKGGVQPDKHDQNLRHLCDQSSSSNRGICCL
jgi:Mo-co oxidoreductase dimerisation domain